MTTNTKNKKKSSAARKLIPAIGMLTVSAMMLSSSTYAWFTMNKTVEVTGMELRTKVGANLLICSDNVEANYSSEQLLEGRKGLLEPVSSINGTTGSFYYTVNATGKGNKQSGATITQYNENQAVANVTAGKLKYDTTFNSTYGVKTSGTFTTSDIGMTNASDGAAYGYIDYVFYLKATADATNTNVNMTECNLLYNNGPVNSSGTVGEDIDRAWRVGVFVTDISSNGGKGYDAVKATDPAASGSNQKAILGLADSQYFSQEGGGVAQAQQDNTATLGNVVNFKNFGAGETGVTLDTIASTGTTKYYKVLLRVWLEGEDNTCNSRTYASLQDNSWKLNCKFDLETDTANAVKGINSDTAKKASSGTQQTAVNTDDVAGA
jgi:hypothetical protein